MKFAPGAWRYALPPLLAAPFALIVGVTPSVLLAALGGAVLAFFRDPERAPPPTGVVSPADGKVSVLREEVHDGERRVRVGVFMNVWNVHVVRAPFDGVVADVEHVPGANRPAFSKESDRNERVRVRFEAGAVGGETDDGSNGASSADAEGGAGVDDVDADPNHERDADGGSTSRDDRPAPDGDPEVTLIAGAFARRITPYVEVEDEVERGERIGHIAFGSRVDVLFPPAIDVEDVAVEPGERVTSGESVLLEATPDAPIDSSETEIDLLGDR